MSIYITGDTHGEFSRLEYFCSRFEVTKKDIMVILGDAGINYFQDERAQKTKNQLSKMPLTIFCIHGNHEARPTSIPSYKEQQWHGGTIYVEEKYPNILFAKDGEVFTFGETKVLVIGGAYSIDKYYRLARGFNWFSDEQPSQEIKNAVEAKIKTLDNKVDVVFSHTCPKKHEPTEVFIAGLDQSKIDKTTEEWLDKIEDTLEYKAWYCGHYHLNKKIDKLNFLFSDIVKLNERP